MLPLRSSNQEYFSIMNALDLCVLPAIKEKKLLQLIGIYLLPCITLFESPLLRDCVEMKVDTKNKQIRLVKQSLQDAGTYDSCDNTFESCWISQDRNLPLQS